jgi:YidC/Oxa1 family membrane protein insertase
MDQKRLLLAIALSFLFFFVYQLVLDRMYPGRSQPRPTPAPAASPTAEMPNGFDDETTEPTVVKAGEPAPEAVETNGPFQVAAAKEQETTRLGSFETDSRFLLCAELTNQGGGISNIFLSHYYDQVVDRIAADRARGDGLTPRKYPLLRPIEFFDSEQGEATIASLITEEVRIEVAERNFPEKKISIADKLWVVEVDRTPEAEIVHYTLDVKLSADYALRLHKKYTVKPGRYDIEITQWAENIGEKQTRFRWVLLGPVGLRKEDPRADVRKIVVAHNVPDGPPATEAVTPAEVVGALREGKESRIAESSGQQELAWVARENKYFASIVCPVAEGKGQRIVSAKGRVNGREQVLIGADPSKSDVSFELITDLTMVRPKGESTPFTVDLYAGPRDKIAFSEDAKYQSRHYHLLTDADTGWCTFNWLTEAVTTLLRVFRVGLGFSFLKVLGLFVGSLVLIAALFYDTLTSDDGPSQPVILAIMGVCALIFTMTLCVGTHNYGLSIMVLVAVVRVLLHPITKKSQIQMQKSSMAMAKLKPRMDALKEKYGGGAEFQRRMLELQKEEGVNPYGAMLGCLPMMLQLPIWVAMYQGIGYSLDLRHQPFGLWIEDLAAPDGLAYLSLDKPFPVPIVGGMMGEIISFNILPLLVATVMLINQKFMPKAGSSDQIKQQQIMAYFMSVFMLLIFYNMPAGLNLYILTSTGVGIIEQWRIRKHVSQMKDEKPKPAESTAMIPRRKTGKKKRR